MIIVDELNSREGDLHTSKINSIARSTSSTHRTGTPPRTHTTTHPQGRTTLGTLHKGQHGRRQHGKYSPHARPLHASRPRKHPGGKLSVAYAWTASISPISKRRGSTACCLNDRDGLQHVPGNFRPPIASIVFNGSTAPTLVDNADSTVNLNLPHRKEPARVPPLVVTTCSDAQ
jgi:hypothetical protein